MKIIEQFIKGKSSEPALCEDMLLITEDFVMVADGVTAKSNRMFSDKTGGRAAAEAVCEAVKGFAGNLTVEEAVEKMTESVASLYGEGEPYGTAATAVIIYSKYRNELWSIGDCQCLINGGFFGHEKEIDRIVSDMRSLVLEMSRRKGATDEELAQNDVGREFILPVIKKQQMFANVTGKFSYGVINGAPVPAEHIVVHKVNAGDEIVLASDGYPTLKSTLRESEELLAAEIKNNPLCDGGYRSTKGLQKGKNSFDDRTYVRFTI